MRARGTHLTQFLWILKGNSFKIRRKYLTFNNPSKVSWYYINGILSLFTKIYTVFHLRHMAPGLSGEIGENNPTVWYKVQSRAVNSPCDIVPSSLTGSCANTIVCGWQYFTETLSCSVLVFLGGSVVAYVPGLVGAGVTGRPSCSCRRLAYPNPPWTTIC